MPESFARFRRSHEFWLLMVIAALVVFLSIATDSFLTFQNLFDLLTSYAFLGILAAGLLVVLISGGIDISFTATASIALSPNQSASARACSCPSGERFISIWLPPKIWW